DDDPRVAQACKDIALQVGQLGTELRIKPEGVPPRKLKEAVDRRDYQLAYYHLDYTSEVYWLWPLFDSGPEALRPGGSNFLGYSDATLQTLFRSAMSYRDFDKVRALTHDIHAHLYEQMPLIPLWQLHTHLAVHPDLTTVHLDPLLVFTHAEE